MWRISHLGISLNSSRNMFKPCTAFKEEYNGSEQRLQQDAHIGGNDHACSHWLLRLTM